MAIALLPGGLLADRVHRGRVMRAASGVGVLLYASLVVAGVLGALTVPHLFVVGVLTGVCAGVFAPAEMSAVRAVVPTEQLPTALSASSRPASTSPAWSAGRSAARCYAVTRWVPFLFDAVTFAVSWVLLGRIRTDLSPVARPSTRAPYAAGPAPTSPRGCGSSGSGRSSAPSWSGGCAPTWSSTRCSWRPRCG